MQQSRIMIVEDQKVLGDNLQRYLRPRGWDTLVVHTGSMALAASRSFRPAVLLLDCHLPDMSGSDVLGGIRERHDCKCVLMTAHPPETVLPWATGFGITRILCKPFSLDEMAGHLAAVCPEHPAAAHRNTTRRA